MFKEKVKYNDYVLKKLISPFILSLILLVIVFVLRAIVKNSGIDKIPALYTLIFSLPYSMNVSILIATIFALGQFIANNKTKAFLISKVGLVKIMAPFLIMGLIFSFTLAIIKNTIEPQVRYHIRKMQLPEEKKPATFFKESTFINYFKDYIVFIHSINGNKLSGIRIYKTTPEDAPARTITAQEGEFISFPEKNMVLLKLENGIKDEPDPENPKRLYKLNFEKYNLELYFAEKISNAKIDKKPREMTIKELNLKKEKDFMVLKRAILHERIASSFTPLVFVLIGIPLGLLIKQRGIVGFIISFFVGLGIAFSHYLVFFFGRALLLTNLMSFIILVWLVNGVIIAVGLFLTYKAIRKLLAA